MSAVWADVNALPQLSIFAICGTCAHGSPQAVRYEGKRDRVAQQLHTRPVLIGKTNHATWQVGLWLGVYRCSAASSNSSVEATALTRTRQSIDILRETDSPVPNGKRLPLHDERWDAAGKYGSVGWHTFRHTHRSWLDETGAPMGVQQKLMRHAQISTTMNVYGNALMEAKREANAAVVSRILRSA